MNIRLICAGDIFWVGGGADLTPFIPYAEDTAAFHGAMEEGCAWFRTGAYNEFKEWCDQYFYIKHRQSPRGVGGIFFDFIEGDFPQLLRLLEQVSEQFVRVYPEILARRALERYTESEKDGQLYWRGRYVEFNLLYDRGTKFGLNSGGNTDAIFVSLPPTVKW